MSRVTAQDVKQSNYLNIYRLFFHHELLSKPQIARLLKLSLPTVVNNVSALEAEGKIQENGMCAPQGGRPATAYRLVDDAAVSIGVEIQSKSIKCAVINLKGDISTVNYFMVNFENSLNYIQSLCHTINGFIADQGYNDSRILGVGISFQGIANKDGQTILYGKILPYDHLSVATLQPYFAYPVILLHDVKCAANAELWHAKQHIHNAVYISVSEHLGGALILNNQIDQGKQGYSGALEHFRINDNGNPCYCGQIGCLETYCSLTALLQSGESLEHFFLKLRTDDQPTYARWLRFLTYFAKALNYVYLLLERDIILGGEIAPYLRDEDLSLLSRLVENHAPFPLSGQFIRIAALQQNAALIGAGLPFIRKYIP
ncbi:sugar kinase [Actinobacillus succinogenes]|uniref:ROK family protein n=1 Tax=Actinobacillus succinogenes (strain ATCC 55618 / DSM 22257 / CCUG 43843 / 130Z) TaxID=339671 RepID=A6VKL4_ACTSZ|nr:ROK family protein [Actinobacillus succinogenes]ABR73511.1 ROK family protein [Actinobacillus succinogenes 130Z]PHI40026.1 sugar kinase [Actinobacillus succinogenes]